MKINRATPDKHKYLAPLGHIKPAPQIVFFRGKLPERRVPSVAIVGTRRPTPYGTEVAHRLAFELAGRGVIVISGLALGTDAIAHKGALEAGGTTIAVLANSVESIYPKSNAQLGERILESGGAILSEYEPPTAARNYQFLARNRIVSGLSDAVVVVEAAARSGTLATVAHALNQGKEVFAVPGNITSPLSQGCNTLLKQGARPATSADDILEIIAPRAATVQTALPLGTTPLETKIIELISGGMRDGDQLQQASGADPSEFGQALTMMELTGTVRALGANRWSLG